MRFDPFVNESPYQGPHFKHNCTLYYTELFSASAPMSFFFETRLACYKNLPFSRKNFPLTPSLCKAQDEKKKLQIILLLKEKERGFSSAGVGESLSSLQIRVSPPGYRSRDTGVGNFTLLVPVKKIT